MPLAAGTRLGSYEILSALGAGGMGEVYRARDTRLDRDVAIKILPEAFAVDADRVARFQREAKVLASLNHPHIAAIYGLEDAGGVKALLMELVEGEDLAQRLARGAIPVDEALPVAKQIAEALEAAHEQGIIHRDLKPANIKVRNDGTVKVLDFGLAKAMDPAAGSPSMSMSPTITTPAMTQAGMILGTAAYMSPEQAKGRHADRRSDVWAFGAVLYEMLSGQRAFKGTDVADTLAAVLRQDIDWTALPASTPLAARRLMARCLDRDLRRRLRDIGEARIVLEDSAAVAANNADGVAAPSPPLWRGAIAVVLGTIAVAVLATAAAVYLRPQRAAPAVTRFPLMLGAGEVFPGGTRQFVAISPDGAHVAYVVNGVGLYVRSMAKLDARLIATADTGFVVLQPVFSPDSGSLVFWSSRDQALKRVSVNGGAAVTICSADQPFGMSWDLGAITFAEGNKGIMRVAETGGTPVVIVSVKEFEQAHGPQILPGGDTVLFTLATGTDSDRWDKAKIVTQSLRSGERKTLLDGASDARYLPTGHLVYAREGIVFAVAMNLRRLEVTGGPVPIIEGVRRAQRPVRASQNLTGAAQFSVSTTGSLVYVPGPVSTVVAQLDLGLIDRQGSVQALGLRPGAYQHPRASPNGKQIAVGTDDGKEAIVWIYDLGSTTSVRRLTFGGKNRFPIWSADGERVAYQSDRNGDLGIFWQRADGSGGAERLTKSEPGTSHVAQSWLPGGDKFLFTVASGSNMSLWASSSRDHKTTQISDKSSVPMNASFSADGRWIAYAASAEGPETGIYVQPFPPTGDRYLISKPSMQPVWSRHGRELIHQPPGGQWAVQAITTEPSFAFSAAVGMSRGGAITTSPTEWRNFDTTPEGRILGVVAAEQTPSTAGTRPQIQVVLNWFEELKARVPTK